MVIVMERFSDITPYQVSFNKKKSKKILKWYQSKKSYGNCPELLSLEESIPLDEQSFLYCLISKISDVEPSSQEEAKAEFKSLSLLCTRPNFLFGTISKEEKRALKKTFSAKNFKKICKEFSKFDSRWSLLFHERELYLYYVNRGTKNLNRDRNDSQDKLSSEEKNELINDMNKLYRGYYYSLLANGYNPVSEPVVDTRLIGHCYEKEWLLPIAHIILIRDAQYQMMGKSKYAQAELLQPGSSLKFELKAKGPGNLVSMRSADEITYEICLEAREILKEHLSKYFLVNPVLNAIQGLTNIEGGDISATTNALDTHYLLSKAKWNLGLYQANDDQAGLIFPIPDCDTHILAKQIGRTTDLSIEQMDQLEKELPALLWTRCNIENTLKSIPSDSSNGPNNRKTVISIVSALRNFLNPYQYYSLKLLNPQETHIFADQLVKSARLLHQKEFENCKSGSNLEIENVTKVFSSFLVFRDITDVGLVLSHAVDPGNGVVIPIILKQYISKLKRVFKAYGKNASVLRLTCADAIRKKDTGYSLPIYCYEYDRYDLRYKRIEDNIAQNLTWDCAREFLLKCVCENTKPGKDTDKETAEKTQRLRQWKYIDEHFSEQLSYFDVNLLSNNNVEKDFIYFKIFSYILKSSLQLLQFEMFKKMLSIFNKVLGV